jgi:hypothetical protein
MAIFPVWIFFRLLTSVFTALVTAFHPLTVLEKSLPLLPPTLPISTWIDRVALSPWLRWDAVWYQQIVLQGYNAHDGTAQFHPLYPWLARVLSSTGTYPLLSLLLISTIACLGFLFMYHRLAKMDLSAEDARFSLLLMLLAPTAFILFAPYSEALFLLCAAGCFYSARQQHWWLAGLAGGLAALTRQQGIFLIFPLAYELWDATGRSWIEAKKYWQQYICLAFIPLSYSLWVCYRYFILSDAAINLEGFKSLVYSLLISPSASAVVPQQSFVWPWQALLYAIQKLITAPDLDIWVNLISATFILVVVVLAWNNMRTAYRLFTVLIILVSFSYYTGPIHPYMGLPRHLLLAFPIFISATPRINRPILGPLFITLCSVVYLILMFLFSLEAWVA